MNTFQAIVTVHRNELTKDLWSVADKFGLELIGFGNGYRMTDGLAGNTYSVKEQLKAAGFRWNSDARAWLAHDRAAFTRLSEG